MHTYINPIYLQIVLFYYNFQNIFFLLGSYTLLLLIFLHQKLFLKYTAFMLII